MDLTVGPERDEVRVPREAIEERGLGGRREQPLALALAVVLEQAGPERGERRRRGELPADPRGRSPVPGDRSREDHLAVLRPLLGVDGRVEPSLHVRGARAVADQRRRSTLPRASSSPTVTIVLPAPVLR